VLDVADEMHARFPPKDDADLRPTCPIESATGVLDKIEHVVTRQSGAKASFATRRSRLRMGGKSCYGKKKRNAVRIAHKRETENRAPWDPLHGRGSDIRDGRCQRNRARRPFRGKVGPVEQTKGRRASPSRRPLGPAIGEALPAREQKNGRRVDSINIRSEH
jgi:hypothetical protein